MKIQLVLSDDWELRGNGSGNMRAIQFDTIRKLCAIYERHGLRGTFNVEVMQQLNHIKFGAEHPHLLDLSKEWEKTVKDVYSRGHDIQLHVHPQWHDARYENHTWKLGKDWALQAYPPDVLRDMLATCKEYLQGLLRQVDSDYRCVSFRSGAWSLAPSEHALPLLAELGIVFDMSIAEGLHYHSEGVQVDYRVLEEGFLPFYPQMEDARRVSGTPQPIVCVPTHSFQKSVMTEMRYSLCLRLSRMPAVSAVVSGLLPDFRRPNETPIPDAGHSASYSQEFWQPAPTQEAPTRQVSDLSALHFADMRDMLRDIRKRARSSGWSCVPVILENHTKDLGDFAPIERFAELVARAADLEVITARELATGIRDVRYPIRQAG